MSAKEKIVQITENTSVPFRIAIPVVTSLGSIVVYATWFLAMKLSAIDAKLDGYWKVSDQQVWADLVRQGNPDFHTPYVSEVLLRRTK